MSLFCSPPSASSTNGWLVRSIRAGLCNGTDCFDLFYTHPIHLGLFIIVLLVKLGMEVDVLCSGGLESYDSCS